MAVEDSVTYGINYRSTLNDIETFHVGNSQLPQDVMHVLLEGVIPLEIKHLLGEFINVKHYFSLGFLNDRVRCFTFSPEEARDKPSSIPDSGALHQTGTYSTYIYCSPQDIVVADQYSKVQIRDTITYNLVMPRFVVP